jgi:transposase
MGQVLHGSARTTEAVRRAIQLRQESVRALARRYGVSPTTIQKWRKRSTTADAPMGPKQPRSTVLTPEEEAMIVAFRRHTLLPLDDCLYGLQPTIPHLTRSSLHRCLERHGISRLPEMKGDKPKTKRFADYAIGYLHIESRRSGPKRESSISSSRSTAPRSWPSPSWREKPIDIRPRTSCVP